MAVMHCFTLIGSVYRRYPTVLSVGVYGNSHLWGGLGVYMDWGLVGLGCWSARPEEKPSSNLNRKRGIELSCIAKNTLLSSDNPPPPPPSIFLFDARSYSIGYRGCRLTSAAVPPRTVWYKEGELISSSTFSRLHSIFTSIVLRSFSPGVLILLFFVFFN